MTPGLQVDEQRRGFFSGTDFPWPVPPGSTTRPRWNGSSFEVESGTARVLTYDATDSHWNDRLSDMNEIEAGREHPIGRESRRLAVGSMLTLAARRPLRILDAGCASGFIFEDLSRALPDADMIGADYLPGPLEKMAGQMPGLPLLQFDLRKCPLPDSCVDGVTCLNVLEHIDDDASALAHMHRILKPGGIAHIEVPSNPALHDIYDEHLMHYRRYRLSEIRALAIAAGFTVKKATHLGFLPYPAFWCVKKWNRRKLSAPEDEKSRIVLRQIRNTRASPLFSLVMRLEAAFSSLLSYPCGIRCVLVLGKDPS